MLSFQTHDSALAFVREKNTGLSLQGKTYGEHMADLVYVGDETGVQACDGNVHVIGDKSVLKHEKATEDSRQSVSAYRVGSVSGKEGPCILKPPGAKRKPAFTDKYLEDHGAPFGSAVVMTPTGYMTAEAWEDYAPYVIKGIRAQVDKINPVWWVIKIVDGYGPHTTSLEAMRLYYDAKILLLKEESYMSHVNQTYDQYKAKEDKSNMREAIALMRRATELNKGVVDGWGLVIVILHAVRESKPDVWVKSAVLVNLHPYHRLPFGEYMATPRMQSFLQGGQNFKVETSVQKYELMPSFWHGMELEEKRLVVRIVDKHAAWTPEFVVELYSMAHIAMKDMQNLRRK